MWLVYGDTDSAINLDNVLEIIVHCKQIALENMAYRYHYYLRCLNGRTLPDNDPGHECYYSVDHVDIFNSADEHLVIAVAQEIHLSIEEGKGLLRIYEAEARAVKALEKARADSSPTEKT